MGELLKEFESVPKRVPGEDCNTALLPENRDKNRFVDVLPYDSSRVELVPTKENNTGYINASHVKVRDARRCLIVVHKTFWLLMPNIRSKEMQPTNQLSKDSNNLYI